MQAFGFMRQPLAAKGEALPYQVRDDFLSPAELNFYRVLCAATGDWAVICPKAPGDPRLNVVLPNRLAQKINRLLHSAKVCGIFYGNLWNVIVPHR
jgi:hypothetical protein